MLKAIWQLLKYLINIMGLNKLLTIFITLFKLPWQINYSFVLNFFANINPNDIINIFACVATLSIAVIIFIAEIIRDGNNDALDKKLYLSTTKLKSYIIQFILIIYLLILLKLFNMPFILLIITLILLIMYIYQTYNILKKAINLLMQKDYYNKSLDNYVLNSVKDIIYKDIVDLNEKEKFLKFINNQRIITLKEIDLKDYTPVLSLKNGVVKGIDVNELKKIEEKIEPDLKDIIKIEDIIGKEIYIDTVIAYIKNTYFKELETYITNMIIYCKDNEYINDQINLINSNYFHKYLKYDEVNGYYNDDCQKVVDYIKYLYQENLTPIRINCFTYLEREAKSLNEYMKILHYSTLLNKILFLAYKYDKIDEYKIINNIIYDMFIKLIKNYEDKLEPICYNYAHIMFNNINYIFKNNKEAYYECNLYYALKYIIYLLSNGNYYGVKIILSNVKLYQRFASQEEFNKYTILNFQFSYTMIHSLIVFLDKYQIPNYHIEELINLIKNKFGIILNAWKVILAFKQYYNNDSLIAKLNNTLEVLFEDFDYLNNHNNYYSLDIETAIYEYLYAFKIYNPYDSKVDKNLIEEKDRFFYKDILRAFNNKSKFANVIKNNCDYTPLKKLLNEALKIANKKETDNLINLQIDLQEKDTLLKIVKDNFNNDELINYLKDNHKIKKSRDKLKEISGFNDLVQRDAFVSNSVLIPYYGEDIASIISSDITYKYINIINKNSIISNKPVEEILNSLTNLDDYVIITSYSSYILSKYNITILEINNVDETYLIKKSDLPILNYCDFNNVIFKKDYVSGSWFSKVVDLATNSAIRKKYINNNDYIKKQDNPDYYLKQLCQVKIFLAYKIEIVNKDMNVLKFIEN